MSAGDFKLSLTRTLDGSFVTICVSESLDASCKYSSSDGRYLGNDYASDAICATVSVTAGVCIS